mmetsp:Transcript_22618/g.37768  ORF Transcript_22618/g.37768 Transcript_22618/m.37768 type:complete len:304 (+) Transcript_22618:445-1356(+)
MGGPVCVGPGLDDGRGLGRYVGDVLLHALHGHDVRLGVRGHAHHPVQRLRDAQRVGDAQPAQPGRHPAAPHHAEAGGEGDDAGAHELQAHGQPSVGADVHEVGLQVAVQLGLVLPHKVPLAAEGADDGGALERLPEVAEHGAARDRVQPLQLAAGGHVVLLGGVIEGRGGHHGQEEVGRHVADHRHCAEYPHQCAQVAVDGGHEDLVDGVGVLGEAVQHAAERRGVVEGHWCPQQRRQHGLVEVARGVEAGEREAHEAEEGGQRRGERQGGVHAQAQGGRDAVVVGPVRQPRVPAHLGALVEQ